MILAGDIGGTKTHLALFEWGMERVEPVREDTFHSADYQSLEEILDEFLNRPTPEPIPSLSDLQEPGDLAHRYAILTPSLASMTFRYSVGITFTNRPLSFFQPLSTRHARTLMVRS